MPLPLFVAARVWPLTTTEIVAELSFTVPVRDGVVSLVVRAFTVIVGAAVSIVSSLAVLSVPALPAASVAVTATL